MKMRYDDLKQAVDFMEKHLGKGGALIAIYDAHLDAIVFKYKSLLDTDTEIEVYEADKTRHVSIQERVWLHRRPKSIVSSNG